MEIEQINKYVGSKIKDYRKSFGLSQEELAKKYLKANYQYDLDSITLSCADKSITLT